MTNLDVVPLSRLSFDLAMQTLVCFTEGTLSQIDLDNLADAIAQDREMRVWFRTQLVAAQDVLDGLTEAEERSGQVAVRS